MFWLLEISVNEGYTESLNEQRLTKIGSRVNVIYRMVKKLSEIVFTKNIERFVVFGGK